MCRLIMKGIKTDAAIIICEMIVPDETTFLKSL